MESPENWFHRRATSYVEAQVLFHLNQVGVFDLLRKGGTYTAAQIADSLHLEVGPTETLLDYLFGVDDLLELDHGGGYSLSDFGKNVIDRFSSTNSDAGQQSINMFDVRVGAYGPVWRNLSRMLTGEARYGEDFHRKGQCAEKAVSKLAMNFWSILSEHVEEIGASSVVEVGLTTVLLQKLRESYPGHVLYGLDKNKSAIERNAASAAAKKIEDIQWIQSDYFNPEAWCDAIDSTRAGLVYSLHFHELIAQGEKRFVEALRELKARLPNWSVLALEQPLLSRSEKDRTSERLWLYSHSNVLIHHLIGNGKILSRDAWKDLGHQAGCRKVTDRSCDYLGYRAFLFQL